MPIDLEQSSLIGLEPERSQATMLLRTRIEADAIATQPRFACFGHVPMNDDLAMIPPTGEEGIENPRQIPLRYENASPSTRYYC